MDNTWPNFMVFQKYMETQGTSVSSYISLSTPQEYIDCWLLIHELMMTTYKRF